MGDSKRARQQLTARDYVALARWRHALRRFTAFSAAAAHAEGLPAQQHQAILAIKGHARNALTVGGLAETLLTTPHAATELVDRLCSSGWVVRNKHPHDRRRLVLTLTAKAERILHRLSVAHLHEIRESAPTLLATLRALVRK
jgi:DNA-binding MarR family transcriptional regulator